MSVRFGVANVLLSVGRLLGIAGRRCQCIASAECCYLYEKFLLIVLNVNLCCLFVIGVCVVVVVVEVISDGALISGSMERKANETENT